MKIKVNICFIVLVIFMCSCGIKKINNDAKTSKLYPIDSLSSSIDTVSQCIEVVECGKIFPKDFNHMTINDVMSGPRISGLLQCLINNAEKGDTLAQAALYEISKRVSNNVHKFDYDNSRYILTFLDLTLFLTPKSNKWIPVLMNFASDINCEHDSSGHWPSGEHFGMWVSGSIISNLTDRRYAKELADYQSKILTDEENKSTKKESRCYWSKKKHKIFMLRLEQDYKDGKLNFE